MPEPFRAKRPLGMQQPCDVVALVAAAQDPGDPESAPRPLNRFGHLLQLVRGGLAVAQRSAEHIAHARRARECKVAVKKLAIQANDWVRALNPHNASSPIFGREAVRLPCKGSQLTLI